MAACLHTEGEIATHPEIFARCCRKPVPKSWHGSRSAVRRAQHFRDASDDGKL